MRVAMCAVMKNESSIIEEWLAFHAEVGFQRFLIYDNGSTDNTVGLIERLSNHLDVEVMDWSRAEPVEYQKSAYSHALQTFGEAADWMAFFDADEFFIPVRDGSVQRFLENFPHSSAIGVPWAMYGSSGLLEPDGRLVIEQYVKRSEQEFGPNRHVKSMLRPQACTSFINGHYGLLEGDYVGVDGQPKLWQHPGVTAEAQDISIARLNHYFTRSRSDWDRKMARGYGDMVRAETDFELYDRNEVEDAAAVVFAQRVRDRLSAWNSRD